MTRLSPEAREQIKFSELTITEYIAEWSTTGEWRGDACGCHDDRCAGYHHDVAEECPCLQQCIARVWATKVRRLPHFVREEIVVDIAHAAKWDSVYGRARDARQQFAAIRARGESQ